MGYTVYRKDRPNKSYGGVMIAVSNDLISTEAPELDTECEVLWVRINLVRAKSLYIGAFYRPPDTDSDYLAHLDTSLSRLTHKNNCNIWLGGDFNAPHVKWETQEVEQQAGGKRALYQQLVDISLDHNLEQVVNIPTRGDNTGPIIYK